MITLNELKAKIQTELNTISSETFKLYTDVGQYKKAYKKHNNNEKV